MITGQPTPILCSQCGAHLGKGQKFCHLCGTAYTPPTEQTQFCRHCGQMLLSDALFCAECGQTVSTAHPPATAAEQPAEKEIASAGPLPAEAAFPLTDPAPVPFPDPLLQPAADSTCPVCGGRITQGQSCCPICGFEVPVYPKAFCRQCGQELLPGLPFCTYCGTTAEEDGSPDPQAPTEVPSPRRLHPVKPVELLKKSLLLLVSLFLLISLFTPVVSYRLYTVTATSEDLSDSALPEVRSKNVSLYYVSDSIVFFLDSFKRNAIEETDDPVYYALAEEAKALEALEESLRQEYPDSWHEQFDNSYYTDYYKLMMRVALRSEKFSPNGSLCLAAALGICYICLVLAVFLLALLSFLSLYFPRLKDLQKHCLRWMAFVPGVAAALYLAIKLSPYISIQLNSNLFAPNLHMGAWLRIAVYAAVALLIGFALARLIATRKEVQISRLIRRVAVCLLAAVLLLLPFQSFFTVRITAQFQDADGESGYPATAVTQLDATGFAQLDLSDYQKELLTRYENDRALNEIQQLFRILTRSASKQIIESGGAFTHIQPILQLSALGFGGYRYSVVFGLGSVALILTVLAAGLLFAGNLYALTADSAPSKGWTIPTKAVLILSAVTVLALLFVIRVLVDANARVAFTVDPPTNAYILLTLSLLMACIPMGRGKSQV